MESHTRIAAVADASGRTMATALRCEAPQLARVTGHRADGTLEISLVGGAAGPLGGDRWTLSLDVGPGASVVVRSVAAMLAQPGAHGAPSVARVDVTVGEGARLDWWPEPVVAVRGCDHTVAVRVDVAGAGVLRWVDEVVLGRHDEEGGRIRLDQRITVDGRPLMAQDVLLGDTVTSGPGGHGPARAVVTAVEWPGADRAGGQAAASVVTRDVRAARLPLARGGTAWTALAPTLTSARAALDPLGLV